MNIDIKNLTLGQLDELQKLICARTKSRPARRDHGEGLPFKIGDCILVRTVTMIQLGRVSHIGRDFIVLQDGGWVADTGRFSKALADGSLNEFEKVEGWFVVGRGAVVDIAAWTHELPKATK